METATPHRPAGCVCGLEPVCPPCDTVPPTCPICLAAYRRRVATYTEEPQP